jgi:hypothetical protein
MAEFLEDVFEDKARSGEGSFAIAYALLKMTEKIGQLGFDSPGTAPNPGALEFVGMQMKQIASALDCLSVTASVDVNNV